MLPAIDDDIKKLNISSKLINKLYSKDLKIIKDIWVLNRKELKEKGLNDKEIKEIIISLQLAGLDLNKKIYD